MTTHSPPTQDAVDHLVRVGFLAAKDGRTFTHPRAVVYLIDDSIACFTIRPRPRGELPHMGWEIQSTRAPIDLFAAAVAAASA